MVKCNPRSSNGKSKGKPKGKRKGKDAKGKGKP